MKSSELLKLLRENDYRLGAWLYKTSVLARMCQETDAVFALTAHRAKKYGLLESAAHGWLYFPMARSIPLSPIDTLARSFRGASSVTYASLESVLSQHGWISQIPMVSTYMTTGREGWIQSRFGTIEYTHTKRKGILNDPRITWDKERQILVASPERALEDLKHVGRNLDLLI